MTKTQSLHRMAFLVSDATLVSMFNHLGNPCVQLAMPCWDLDVPRDAKVVSVDWRIDMLAFQVVLEHDSFPATPERVAIPIAEQSLVWFRLDDRYRRAPRPPDRA